MAQDRYAKLELAIRDGFRSFFLEELSTKKERAVLLPGFDVPRADSVDLYLDGAGSVWLGVVQRSDYVSVYRHTVGQLIGTLVHFHRMTARQLREAVRASKQHPDQERLKQGRINALNTSKRLDADRKAGNVSLVLATELPDVPQQGRELHANLMPILDELRTYLCASIKKRRICQNLRAYGVLIGQEGTDVIPLAQVLKPMLK